MFDKNSILSRLRRGVTQLSPGDMRLLLIDIITRIEALENEQANRASGSDPVSGEENSSSGTGKRGRPRKSDGESAEETGSA